MLKVNNLEFSYGSHRVLDGVSFEARKGELLCVLGPNGAGKSTLFRCILGFLKNYGGEIISGGRDVRELSPRERAELMAYIPQSTAKSFAYSALDMVLMGTSSRMSSFLMPGQREKDRALSAMRRLGIEELAGRMYTSLSGGEQQLILIARALAQGAEQLIMDEPTSSLDYGNQMRVERILHELAREGYTIIQSTHNPEQTYMFADRILAIRDGRVLREGSPEDVMDETLIRELYGLEVSVLDSPGGRARFFEIKEQNE